MIVIEANFNLIPHEIYVIKAQNLYKAFVIFQHSNKDSLQAI